MEGRRTAQGEPSDGNGVKEVTMYSFYSSSSRQRRSENEKWMLNQCCRWMVYVVKHCVNTVTSLVNI